MPSKKSEPSNGLPPRPKPSTSPSNLPPHSSSVPSTPHQRARKFSFGSGDQSPNANPSHSPRSVYSEANGTVPSLRPLPSRQGRCKYETSLPHSRRRIPYSIGSDPLEKSDLTQIQSKLSEEDERRLTTDMRELYDRLQPTSMVEANRQKLVRKLEKLLNDRWPGHDIRVHLFGSSGNLLCSDDSDVDICIVTPWKELEDKLQPAYQRLDGMEKVVCVSSAKVPIVKIWDPELNLACDLNVNNTLALENTRMIKTYVEIDDRVRPLAMIVKHWTRRRVINDAAFGGTLSSYTWICMIIAFLQLRQPAVVPALHQRPHLRLPKKNGELAAFADDVEKLRGYGDKNKATLGELLFQFFRFYAHEFDYSTYVLSVRLGKLVTKKDKKWHLALHNQLCIEEPFNINRNLGNTADDTAFRGLQLELRRAFDLIAKGNLDECCEQFVFPKEEERIFQKPPTVSRPVLLRSASQQHNSRGGRSGGNRGGNRQQGTYRNNGNGNNRRASSSVAYDTNANAMYLAAAYPMAMTAQDAAAMYMQQPSPEALAQTLSALQLQENNLRFLQYTQSQAFAQQQALAHAQRMQGAVQQGQPSSAERSRTNSFDTPPLSAPLRNEVRPELQYFYPMAYQPAAFYGQQHGFPTYPSSPSTAQAGDYRRTSHRSPVANDASFTLSGSSMRSQSQPASRPAASIPSSQSLPGASETPTEVPIPSRHLNGIPMPSFIPDEGIDTEHEGSRANTPPEKERQIGQSPRLSSPANRPNGQSGVMPAFGDIGAQASRRSPRRLSSEQFPQSVLDRIKRTSRSPSPLGHGRTVSAAGSASPGEYSQLSAPLVVNGSISKPPNGIASRQPWASPNTAANYGAFDNPLHISPPVETAGSVSTPSTSQSPTAPNGSSPASDRPVIVNGSTPIPMNAVHPGYDFPNHMAFPAHTANMNYAPFPVGAYGSTGTNGTAGKTFLRFPLRQPSSPLIAQLDLATGDRQQPTEFPHLSPVYEANSPSPSFSRKLELPSNPAVAHPTSGAESRPEDGTDAPSSKGKQKSAVEIPRPEGPNLPNSRVNGFARENGHVRSAKSESDNATGNGWQKIPKGRKKGVETKSRNDAYPQSEQLPKNDSERKGG
ncbi:hypothetical protein DL764_007761 [Monosporascus ibericus]|uniref:polynucleotide adenylyltransferase n=1 Tax=Monosporascus ibericus TaxID=155417 RepID=A0A4Q4SZ87_9PEZI|nr:hypothetical protein DL764_007761 [Monosporascus ibericus]